MLQLLQQTLNLNSLFCFQIIIEPHNRFIIVVLKMGLVFQCANFMVSIYRETQKYYCIARVIIARLRDGPTYTHTYVQR